MYRAIALECDALECDRQAAETENERLRQLLLETAQLWMQTALNVERWAAAPDDTSPKPGR
jgi:hypothetical protein